MTYELFGLPGSGKTFFVNNSTNRKPIHLGKYQKIFWFLLSFLRHPLFYLYVFKELFFKTNTPPKLYFKKIALLIEYGGKTNFMLHKKNSILDEGLIYYIIPLYDCEIGIDKIKKYYNLLFYKPEKIIILKVPKKIRIRRQKFRKRIPRERYGKKYFSKWEQTSIKNYTLIVKYLKTYFNCEIVRNYEKQP